jgi:hypothetical protein
MTKFRQGKARTNLENGKKTFEWPLEKREEGTPANEWREMIAYPTREACRVALRQIRTETQSKS